MSRTERGFQGAKLVGVELDTTSVQTVEMPADAENGVDAGTLQEQLTALAARVQALEDAAAA